MEKTFKICDRCFEGGIDEDGMRDQMQVGNFSIATEVRFFIGPDELVADLCQAHQEDLDGLRSQLEAYRPVARPVKPKRQRTRDADSQIAKIRDWARERGMDVASRGRINDEVMAAYEQRDGQASSLGV
jgi:hypothetical protein